MKFRFAGAKASGVAVGVGVAALLLASSFSSAAAADAVGLGTADSFAVLAGAGVTNTGPSVIGGDLGSCPTESITGFPPGVVNGTTHANDAVACGAQNDATIAYNDAAGRAPTTTFNTPTDLGGLTLAGGVYKSPTSFGITGTLTLDGENNPDSIFVFQAGSTVITEPNSSVSLIRGAQACNVFWQVGSSGTHGVGSHFVGTMIALTSITANTNAVISGRLLARNGAVTLDSNVVTRPSCAPASSSTTASSPTTVAGTPTTVAGTPTTVAGTPTTVAGTPTTVASSPTTAGGSSSTTALGAATTPGSSTTAPGSTQGPVPPPRGPSNHTGTELPRTGARTSSLLMLGIALVAIGALLSASRRRATNSR